MYVTFVFCLQVNTTDVSNMGHTDVVNLVRAAPRVVDLVVGRVLEAPKPPIEAHLLPDICFKGSQEPLGKKQPSLKRLKKTLLIMRTERWTSSGLSSPLWHVCVFFLETEEEDKEKLSPIVT